MAEEKRFENKIKKFLEENGIWYVKFFSNMFTGAGTPDILACCRGRFIAIEVKATKGKPRKLQEYHIKKIQEAGGYARFLYPHEFEDFKREIKEMLEDV